MNTFYKILGNSLLANATNSFLWFALTFWIYLETRSVIATALIGALYPLLTSASGILFGTYVDKHKKKQAMLLSSQISFICFLLASIIFFIQPAENFVNITNPAIWLFTILIMIGASAGNLRNIALSTTVTILIDEDRRDRANGMVGTVNGLSFVLTSVFSGLAIGQIGMSGTLLIVIILSLVVLLHLYTIKFKGDKAVINNDQDQISSNFDFKGSISAVNKISGLWGLIFFTMINNLLGGVFFSLLDPYGLEIVSVEIWGIISGVAGTAFIVSGIIISKFGLGKNPLKTLFFTNIGIWFIGIIFPLNESVFLLIFGMYFYMLLYPFIESAEQTLLQKVVPLNEQGRVFGFAQTLENSVTPLMALLAGPIAQLFFIPFMTTGSGVNLIGDWFGIGVGRGIGLLFIVISLIGFILTILAFNSPIYRRINREFLSK